MANPRVFSETPGDMVAQNGKESSWSQHQGQSIFPVLRNHSNGTLCLSPLPPPYYNNSPFRIKLSQEVAPLHRLGESLVVFHQQLPDEALLNSG